jgi:hypothetical protein
VRLRSILLGALPLLASCGQAYTVDPGGQAGADGGAPQVVPDACDLSKEAKDSPACVSDGVGFFVDGTKGNDTASGTQAAPFRTIQKAVGAIGNKTRVFVCGGTYPESVRLPSRAKLYGGFTCDSWVYDASIRVDVAPAAVGPALLVKNASDVTITDVFFRAQPGTALAKGSVAGLIQSSQGVHFVRGELVAGAGTKGNDGVLTPATFPVQVNGQNGQLDVLPPPPRASRTLAPTEAPRRAATAATASEPRQRQEARRELVVLQGARAAPLGSVGRPVRRESRWSRVPEALPPRTAASASQVALAAAAAGVPAP